MARKTKVTMEYKYGGIKIDTPYSASFISRIRTLYRKIQEMGRKIMVRCAVSVALCPGIILDVFDVMLKPPIITDYGFRSTRRSAPSIS